MGLSFSAFRKELSSKRFKRSYEGFRAECPALLPYPNHAALIAFFHDKTEDLDGKDTILFELITRYRGDLRHRDIAPLFIVLFTPALASIYAYGRRRCPGFDREDLIQDICLLLIQTIKDIELFPYKVAGKIVGDLRNRVRTLLNLSPDEEFVELKGDGTDEFETSQENVMSDDDEDEKIERVVMETTALLDYLIRARKITRKEKRIIMDTLIGEKSLKDALPPSDYDRLKRRRLRIIELIKKHFAK